jgi:hypothetical protein
VKYYVSNMNQATDFQGRVHTLVRLAWTILAVGYLLLWLSSLPGYYEHASTLTIEPFNLGERPIYNNDIAQTEANQRGITVQANAVYNIVHDLIQVLVFYGVAGIILWRAANGFGWYTAFVLMLFATTAMSGAIGVAPSFPGAIIAIEIPAYIVWPLWLAWLAFFPNGQIAPRRAFLPFSVTIALFIGLQVANILAVMGILPSQIDTFSASLGGYGLLPVLGFVLFSQIYRYRRVFTFAQRQQTKWFLFGLGIFFAAIPLSLLIGNSSRAFYLIQEFFYVLFLLFPVTVAIAILRYQLFDIDVIVRKTLVYTVLSGLLALVYFGMVVLLQSLFDSVSGQQSPIAIVISTLVIAALFAPLRQRVQAVIDRRFYRQKYDAQQVLAQFAITARDETDMEALQAELLRVVQETMQPESVSLWLKPTNDRKRTAADGLRNKV